MGMIGRHWVNRAFGRLIVSAAWVVCLQSAAQAQEATTPAPEVPKLVAAQTTIRMDVKQPGFTDTRRSGIAEGALLMTNQGTASASGLQVSGVFSNGTKFEVAATTAEGDLTNLDVNEDIVINLTFSWDSEEPETGTILVEVENAGGAPLTVPFTVRELVPGPVFGWAAFWSALAAVVLTLLTYASLRIVPRDRADSTPKLPSVSYVVYPVANWTFTGSWASSVTAVGAILGTLLAASGFLSEVLPGLATGLFLGVNVGYLVVVALAAVVYTASHNAEGKPTYLALLAAACVTLQ
jgi:hypothetical protein